VRAALIFKDSRRQQLGHIGGAHIDAKVPDQVFDVRTAIVPGDQGLDLLVGQMGQLRV
jgi:hypothetical protein